jgi:NADH dehydrogenase [ubiquinone] 1 alpha subcomplex assembly factor 6
MPAIVETARERDTLGDLLRRHDRDRYLLALFAPAERRGAVMTLYAFNFEIARIRETVSEIPLGQIRLQWWRDAIASSYGDGAVQKHEVATALAAAIRHYRLEPAHFERLLDARERDLSGEPPATLAALESYAEESSAPLQMAALEILGVRDADATRAACEAAIAYALSGLLRATPFLARTRRSILPRALVDEVALDLEALFAGRGSPQLAVVVRAIADRAAFHLDAARRLRARIPRAALPALLPAVLAAADLTRLRRARYDVLAPSLARPDPWRSWRLTMAMLRGRY